MAYVKRDGEKGELAAGDLPQRMAQVHISRIAELPRIELYLDQVLAIVADELSFMLLPGEVAITGSMVNNYVKQKVVPAPNRKRYTRRHVASLLFVTAMKRVYSIGQIASIMGMIDRSDVDVSALYDEVVALVERSLAQRFGGAEAGALGDAAPIGEPRLTQAPPELARVLEAAVASLAAKVYVEQTLALQDEQK